MKKVHQAIKTILPTPIRVLRRQGIQTFLRIRQGIQTFRNSRFKPYVKKKNVEGVSFDFWIGDLTGRDWYDLTCTDPIWTELGFIRDHMIRKGDVVFDCGAHHGCVTIVLSKWVGNEGKIVAFEPVPKNFEIIRNNLDLNSIANVIIERKAVGGRSGKVNIDGMSCSSIVSSRGITVELTTLDEYESLHPSLLKIDVEGLEVEALKGAKVILSQRPKLAIEIHTEVLPRFGSNIEDLFTLINVGDYKFWIQWNDGELPEEYHFEKPITKRVHLFCIPIIAGI